MTLVRMVLALFGVLMVFSRFLPAVAAASGPWPDDHDHDAMAIDLGNSLYSELFSELSRDHRFTREELDQLFQGLSVNKRVLELMDTQWEAKPYYLYRPRFVTDEMVREGKAKMAEYETLLKAIQEEFGVEKEAVIAIWGVESRFGRKEGAFNVFQTLNSLFYAYPRRSQFYRGELIHFLLLCRENGVDPRNITGSYGGAFGQTQFIPSSFREYAVDYDRDGKRDVWDSTADVLASIANYLHCFGWTMNAPVYRELGSGLKDPALVAAYNKGRKGFINWQEVNRLQGVELDAPPGNKDITIVGLELADGGMRYVAGYPNFQAITAWNNSNRYAMVISELTGLLRE